MSPDIMHLILGLGFTVAVLVLLVALLRRGEKQIASGNAQEDMPDVDSLAAGKQPQGYEVGAQIKSGKSTGYGYPGDPTGGGSIGYKGQKLQSTEDFFAGRSKYVSVALNPDLMNKLWPRSDREFRNAPMMYSPAIDKRYAKELQSMGLQHVPLVAMDIGPGVKRQQMDVYVPTREEAFSLPGSPEVNADILVRSES
jgi:hypothetical protein